LAKLFDDKGRPKVRHFVGSGTGARMRGLPQGARMVTLPFRVLDNVGLSQFARMPLENLLGALPRTCGMQGWP
jgi:hypothetical protein